MKKKRTLRLPPNSRGIRRAAKILGRGGLVAFPTETVYGLGARAFDAKAVRRVFQAKGRPAADPLIVHIAGARDLEAVVGRAGREMETARRLARRFWPGPLTLVVPRGRRVPKVVTGGQDTVAVRAPDHPVAQRLIEVAGPLVGPSANRFGRLSPTDAEAVLADLGGRIDAVLDAGPTSVGVESTILDLVGPRPRILRPGGVSRAALERVIGRKIPVARKAVAPGRFGRHYAPRARLVLVPRAALARRAAELARGGERVGVLRLPDDPRLAARVLYARLRALDAEVDVIVCARVPRNEAWEAVADRLRRAALPS